MRVAHFIRTIISNSDHDMEYNVYYLIFLFTAEAETKPTIVLRTRRKKTKRKRGKKHGIMKKKKHHFKKWKKFMLPLLIAYKLKFFTLVPLLFGILKLILAATSFAGFFFALFAVSLTMKNRQQHHQYPGA